MANNMMSDLNFGNRKVDEGDWRNWPNTSRWNSTVTKKVITIGGALAAAAWCWNLISSLAREVPRERPRFSEDDRRNPRR